MKKLLLLTLSILLICSGYSQEKKWEIGGELGFNISTLSGKWSDNYDAKHKWIGSPTIGFTSAYNFTPMISVVGGLFMIKSGAKYIYNYTSEYGTSIEYTQRERYTNLRIPIAARFMWGTTWQYYGMLGFYVSKILCGKYVDEIASQDYKESGKIKFGDEPDNYTGSDWYLDKERFRRLSFGLQIGAGIRKMIGPGYVAFNVAFGLGLCDFYKWKGTDQNGQPYEKPDGYKKFSDRNLSFNIGYSYPF